MVQKDSAQKTEWFWNKKEKKDKDKVGALYEYAQVVHTCGVPCVQLVNVKRKSRSVRENVSMTSDMLVV